MDCSPKKVAAIKSPERDGRCGSGRSRRLDCITNFDNLFFTTRHGQQEP